MQVIIQTIVTNAMGENAYLVCNKDMQTAFVVDPGGSPDAILAACAAQGCALTDILLTHGHFDHIEAVAALRGSTGARVTIHSADADMLTDLRRSLGRQGYEHVQGAADRLLETAESEDAEICGIPVRIMHTPGHTAGSVCYYLPDERTLLAGDTLFYEGFGRTDLPTGSMLQLRGSLRRLYAMPADTRVLPGHGPETTIEHEVQFR